MPTLQEVTLAHSRRLSEIYRTRDVRIARAQSLRDVQLRALPSTAKAYEKYDEALSADATSAALRAEAAFASVAICFSRAADSASSYFA